MNKVDEMGQFYSDLESLLSRHDEAHVFALIRSEQGLELLASDGDIIAQLGMLEAAKIILTARLLSHNTMTQVDHNPEEKERVQ